MMITLHSAGKVMRAFTTELFTTYVPEFTNIQEMKSKPEFSQFKNVDRLKMALNSQIRRFGSILHAPTLVTND